MNVFFEMHVHVALGQDELMDLSVKPSDVPEHPLPPALSTWAEWYIPQLHGNIPGVPVVTMVCDLWTTWQPPDGQEWLQK